MALDTIKDLLAYKKRVIMEAGYYYKTITLYCKPLSIIRSENGGVEGYEVLHVFEVEDYLLGKNPSSSRKEILSPSNTPGEIKLYFTAKEQGLTR